MVCDDLEVVQSKWICSLTAHAVEIMAWVRQLERKALRTRVNQSFTIACSYFGDNIDLEAMSHGYTPGYEVHELEEMETAVAPLL